MTSTFQRARAAAFAAALALAPAAALANTAAQFLGTGSTFPAFDTDETVGWSFSTNADLKVTRLGWFVNRPTLANDHQVGIWDSSGVLLGSGAVLSPGPSSPDGFRYVSTLAAPFVLASGKTYFIGGRDTIGDGDSYVTSLNSLVTDPAITFLGAARSASASGFAFPSLTSAGVRGRFGPNFQFDVIPKVASAAPEPASWAMMILGFGLAGTLLRRRGAVSAA